MARTTQARVDIIADSGSYVASVKRAMAATDKFNRSTKKVKGNPFKSVTRSVAGLAGAYIGAQGLITVVQGAVREQQQSIKVGRQTNAVLKSTKSAAGLSAKAISDLAQALSEKTAIDDEAIQSAENLLLTFTKIGKETFPTATQAVLDLSAATGTSLKGASIQVGKALQDPVRGLTALRKVGVNFSTDQQAVIKKLVETGKTAEAQKLILKELATEFGGSAAAQATPLDRLKVTYQNLLETIGGYLVPVLNDVAEATMKFVDQFRAGKGAGGEFKDTLKGIYDTLKPIVAFLINHPGLVAGAAAAYIAFKATLAALNLFSTLMTAFGTVAQYAVAGRVRGAAFAGSVKGAVAGLGKLGTVGVILSGMFAVDQYGPSVDKWQKGLSAKIKAKFPSFRKSGSDLIDAFANALKQGGMPSIGLAIQGARKTAKASKGGFVSDGKAIVASLSKGISGAASSVGRAVSGAVAKGKSAVSSAVSWFRNIGSNIANAIASGIRGSFNAVQNAAQDLANALPGWAKKVLGISSPSKVFAEIGRNAGRGLIVGLMATLPAVRAAGVAVANAASFGVGDELAVGTAQRNAGMARTRGGKRRTATTLRNAERRQRFNEAKGTLQTFINSLVDKIKSAKLAEIMAPVDKARNKRAADEYASSKVSLSTQIARAQADANNPKAQERYQREAARLDARIQAARAAGNLEAEDALQSEKDALDARYGPAYLTGLQDQLAQLNENEIERTSEAAATAFAETFRKGFDSALTQLLNGGTVEQFFKRIGKTLAGSGVAPGDTTDISGGAGTAAGTIAPSGWASRFSRYFKNKPKGSFAASAIGATIGASQAAVYAHRRSAPAGYKIQNKASGGLLTPGALTLVGETGPELIVGGKVNSATRTSRMGGGVAGMNITINAHGAAANDPVLLARELGWQLATR